MTPAGRQVRIPAALQRRRPLLCAGLIGYRSLVLAGDAKRLGVSGPSAWWQDLTVQPQPARRAHWGW